MTLREKGQDNLILRNPTFAKVRRRYTIYEFRTDAYCSILGARRTSRDQNVGGKKYNIVVGSKVVPSSIWWVNEDAFILKCRNEIAF